MRSAAVALVILAAAAIGAAHAADTFGIPPGLPGSGERARPAPDQARPEFVRAAVDCEPGGTNERCVVVVIDKATGCQYLTGISWAPAGVPAPRVYTGLTPRLRRDGAPWCASEAP